VVIWEDDQSANDNLCTVVVKI